MNKQLLLFTSTLFISCGFQHLQAQTTFDESTPVTQLPEGVTYQAGPGATNSYNWAYPYGTKLTVNTQGGHRNLELLVDAKANSNLRFRQYDMYTASWTSWEHIITAKGNAEINGGLSLTGPNSIPAIRLNQNGSAILNGNASSYTEISSNATGQYLRQYGNDGSTLSWLIRGYAVEGVQALFNDGGINVNGTVQSREVNVNMDEWSDYVFDENYELLPLKDLKTYIQTNKHLPGIPSEGEVLKEGINLGEMNAKLLAKIEELTLHLIAQQEELTELRELKKDVQALKELLTQKSLNTNPK